MRLQPTPERARSLRRSSGAEGTPNSPGSANKPHLRLNIPRVNNPDATPLRVSFRERSASPPTGDEYDSARRRAEEEEERLRRDPEERARLAEAIRTFYAKHAPHKAHQADAIAKAFLSRRGGVEELMGKLRSIYGDVPKYSLGRGGGSESSNSSDDDDASMSTSTEETDDGDDDDDDDEDEDEDDESDDSLSKYDHTRRDSRGPETRSPERRPRRVQVSE